MRPLPDGQERPGVAWVDLVSFNLVIHEEVESHTEKVEIKNSTPVSSRSPCVGEGFLIPRRYEVRDRIFHEFVWSPPSVVGPILPMMGKDLLVSEGNDVPERTGFRDRLPSVLLVTTRKKDLLYKQMHHSILDRENPFA